MGLFRKTMAVSTLGVVRYKSNAERRASGIEAQGKAAKRVAKAEARLLDAQRKQIEKATEATD